MYNENEIPFIYRQNAFCFDYIYNNNEEFILDDNVYRGFDKKSDEKIYKTQSFNLNNLKTEVKLQRFKTF